MKSIKIKAMALAICVAFLVTIIGIASSETSANMRNTNQDLTAEIAQLAPSTELRGKNVLLYANYLDDGWEKNQVKKILTNAGATVTETKTTSPSTLKSQLAGKDVFVVPELYDAHWPTPSELAALNTTFSGFSPVLNDFIKAGGTVTVSYTHLTLPTN